jgi:ATP-dependent Clp protease ATP-binding subunit ClpB
MTFNPEQLTVKAQQAIQRAQELAESRQHRILRPLHLLRSLLEESDGIMTPLLHRIGADKGQLSQIVDGELDRLPQSSGSTEPASAGPETVKVLNAAQTQARLMKDEFLSTEHLLNRFNSGRRSG